MRSKVLTGAFWRLLLVVAAAACGGKDLVLPPTGIGVEGDTVVFAGGAITMIVPESAVTQNVEVNVTVTSNVPSAPTLLINGGLDITVEPAVTFQKPITLLINYQDADIPAGVNESEIAVYKVVAGAWQRVATSSVNTAINQVSVTLTSFSTYGVLGAPVASVTVTPNPASVQAGQTLAMTAVVEDADGNDLTARPVTWQSSATSTATVAAGSGAGQTATVTGVAGGSATITATSQGVNGTSALTVTTAPPPPPPGPHNEPAGFTALVERPFNTMATSGADRGTGNFPNKVGGAEGWDGAESAYPLITIQNDPTAPNPTGGPTNVQRHQFTAGTVPAGTTLSPGVTQTQGFTGSAHGGKQFKKMYVRLYWRTSSNWQPHPAGTSIEFFRSNDTPGGKFEPILAIAGGAPPLRMIVNLQGTQDNARNGTGVMTANTAQAPSTEVDNLVAGKWYKIEVLLHMNSAFNVADGILRIWLDGVMVMNYTDIRYLRDGNNAYFWDTVHQVAKWGGQAGTLNQTQYVFYDHVYVSGAP